MVDGMKNYYPELMATAILLSVVACAVVFAPENSREVQIYMDPENNVVCYYTKQNMQCFTYTDEGTHLQLNG